MDVFGREGKGERKREEEKRKKARRGNDPGGVLGGAPGRLLPRGRKKGKES